MANGETTGQEPAMEEVSRDFYQKLRAGIRRWADSGTKPRGLWTDYLLCAPDLFHLLCKLSVDSDVPVRERGKLAAALAYFISPFDLMPEAVMGILGFSDDIALAAYMLHALISRCGPGVVQRHWAGDEDVLSFIQKAVGLADKAGRAGILGKRGWKRIRRFF